MADPSMKRAPIIESAPPVVDRRTVMTPAQSISSGSPVLSAAEREPLPPRYAPGTVHRPPPSIGPSDHSDPSEPDDDYKTININITIKIPSSFKFPCFRRCKRRRGEPQPPPDTIRGMRTGIPPAERKRRVLAVIVLIFYLSFVICGAVAWGIRNGRNVYAVPEPLPAIETFAPFLDLFVLYSTVLAIKRHQDNDKLGFRYFFLFALNVALFVLHLVVLILAAIRAKREEDYSGYWSSRGHYWRGMWDVQEVTALIFYNTATMIIIKLITFVAMFRKRVLRQKFRQGVSSIPAFIGQEYRYHALTQDVDEDAMGIDSARSSTEQHGRVYLA